MGLWSPRSWRASDSLVIESIDVTMYPPEHCHQQWVLPEHLGPTFVTIYQHLYEERKKHAKGSPERDAQAGA